MVSSKIHTHFERDDLGEMMLNLVNPRFPANALVGQKVLVSKGWRLRTKTYENNDATGCRREMKRRDGKGWLSWGQHLRVSQVQNGLEPCPAVVSAQTHQGPKMTGLYMRYMDPGGFRLNINQKNKNNGRFWNAIGGRVYVASRSRKGRCWSLGGLPIADPM